MGVAITIDDQEKAGHHFRVHGRFVLSGNYAAGGIAVAWGAAGVKSSQSPRIVVALGKSGYRYLYDVENAKLLVLAGNANAVFDAYSPGGGDIKGSANTNSENADAASLPTNGGLIMAAAAVTGGAWTYSESNEVAVPRNLGIFITNDSGGPLNLYEGASVFTLTGTWRGAVQTETITFTSTAGNKAVATAKFRYKYGLKPFDTLTSVTCNNLPGDGLKIGVGIGSKIGLPNDLYTPIEADVTKIVKNAANLSPSGIVDTTYMTVNLGTLSDGDDVEITYKRAGGGELSATALPSGVTGDVIRFVADFPAF